MVTTILNQLIFSSGNFDTNDTSVHSSMKGMSDLLAPLMVEIGNEADAFWCFVGLMNNTIFVSSPRDNDMEMQLSYLR